MARKFGPKYSRQSTLFQPSQNAVCVIPRRTHEKLIQFQTQRPGNPAQSFKTVSTGLTLLKSQCAVVRLINWRLVLACYYSRCNSAIPLWWFRSAYQGYRHVLPKHHPLKSFPDFFTEATDVGWSGLCASCCTDTLSCSVRSSNFRPLSFRCLVSNLLFSLDWKLQKLKILYPIFLFWHTAFHG